jgi:hypothetical protein
LSPERLFVVLSVYLVRSYPWPELIYPADLACLTQRFPAMDWDRVTAIAWRTGTHRLCAVSLALFGTLPGASMPATASRLTASVGS